MKTKLRDTKSIRISVIICCYDEEKTIHSALESLVNQDIESSAYEVVIIDDGSQDKSSQIIKEFISSRKTFEYPVLKYYRKKNEGLSIARNLGIKKSAADFIVYIDGDATANRDFLNVIIDYFDNHQNVNCLGGEVELYNSNIRFARLIQDSIVSLYMSDKNTIIGTNMAYRKSFLIQAGGFQPEFTRRGDETAFFAKAKENLIRGRSKKMIVKHSQPPNVKAWLKTRYENGFFSTAIDFFMEKPLSLICLKVIKSLVFVCMPFLSLISLVLIFISLKVGIILLTMSLIIFLQKFIFNGLIQDTLREFKKNRGSETRLREMLEIVILILRGIYKSELGRIKGFNRFKNVKWQETVI